MQNYWTKGLVFLTIWFTLATSNVSYSNEPRLTPAQNAIFQRVLAGELNNRIHNEFWSLFTQEQISDMRHSQERLVEGYGLAIVWQRQVWMSIRDSYKSQKIVKSSDYETYKNKVAVSGLGTTPIKNAEEMIGLASLRKNLRTQQGLIELTDETAETILINLDSSFARVKKLFDPDWRFEIDSASPEAYAKVVSQQDTWQKKSAACFRFWDILHATVSLSYEMKLKGKGAPPTKKHANSLFNIKWRRNFIDLVIEENNLQDLRDEAYAYGAGVDLMDKGNPKIIQKTCGAGINNYLKSNKNISQKAMELAKQQMLELTAR
jgi:hypothetical protein